MKIFKIVNGYFQVNTYIVGDDEGKSCYIIDPGQFPKPILKKAKEEFKEVKGILVTHGHFDHTWGIDYLVDNLNCPVYMSDKDFCHIDGSFKDNPVFASVLVTLKCKVTSCFELKDDNIIVYETPGHSKGSVSYFFKNENILFTGDALFRGAVGRTDLPGGSEKETISTLKFFKSLDDSIIIYPGHEGQSTIKEEKLFNPYLLSI